MKTTLTLLWAILFASAVGLRADVDLDALFSDDEADEAVSDVAAEFDTDLDDEDAGEIDVEIEIEEDVEIEEEIEVVEEIEIEIAEDDDLAEAAPAAVPEPTLAAPEAAAAEPVAEDDGPSIGYRLAMWLPNRLLDLNDCVSVGLGAGAKITLEPRVTQYFQLGGSYGDQYFLANGYNRQLGGGFESGWSRQALCWAMEKRYVEDTFGGVKAYMQNQRACAVPSREMPVYGEGARDLWAIGTAAGWLVNVDVHFHPVAFADFLTGLVLYDLSDDDL